MGQTDYKPRFAAFYPSQRQSGLTNEPTAGSITLAPPAVKVIFNTIPLQSGVEFQLDEPLPQGYNFQFRYSEGDCAS